MESSDILALTVIALMTILFVVIILITDFRLFSSATRRPYVETQNRFLTKCPHRHNVWIGSPSCTKCRHFKLKTASLVYCSSEADHA